MLSLNLMVWGRLVFVFMASLLWQLDGVRSGGTGISSNTTQTVAIRSYEDGDSIFLHIQCYRYNGEDSLASEPSDCCDALARALDGWTKETLVTYRYLGNDRISQLCLQETVEVPKPIGKDLILPKFSFWYSSREQGAESSSLFPPPMPQRPSSSDYYVWDVATATGRRLRDTTQYSVFNLLGDRAALDDYDANPPRLTAHMESDLSASGGMHRDLRHRITLSTPKKKNDIKAAESSVSLYVLIHLPSDLFVNVEDIFRIDSDPTSMKVSLVPSGTIIDQEEPAFVSPPHALLVHITATNIRDDDLILEFATKLHVRYPRPFADNSAVGNFRRVLLPPPELVAGTVAATRNDDDEKPNSIRIMNLNTPHQQQQQSSLLMLWVAAGHQKHYAITFFATLAVAVGGAVVMLRDIAAASVWDD